jgi:hypothetical protein
MRRPRSRRLQATEDHDAPAADRFLAVAEFQQYYQYAPPEMKASVQEYLETIKTKPVLESAST